MVLKRLVTSAATIAMFGCSDGATEGALPPPFSGTVPSEPAGTPPVDSAGVPGQMPAPAAPDPSSNAGGEDPAPAPSSSEGQSPDSIGLAPSAMPGAEPGGGTASTGMEAGAEQGQPSAEAPAETPAEETPAEETPVPDEPEPIVRPPLNCGAPPPALEGGIQGCQAEDQGSVAGQDWFLWYTGGSGCMTTYDNLSGAFSAQWNNPSDFLARIGFWFDETQTFEELGELGADMAFTRQGSAGGFSFIGVYGWTTNPLVEYYIVEDSFGNGPAQPFGDQLRGNFNVDGAQYNLYSGNKQNQPNITGTNANFTQVVSVRQNPRQCGHVSISEHFRQWEGMGINLGLMKEAKILVEAGGGNGSITFTHANVTVTPPN